MYPHQDHYVVPASAVLEVPDDVPAKRAVLAANMETAINGVWDAEPMLGEHICVIGAGVVGTLVAYLCAQVPGVNVQLVDINPERRQLAEQLGWHLLPRNKSPMTRTVSSTLAAILQAYAKPLNGLAVKGALSK
ncbi:hypothetical protein HSBAA_15440 [Vreelandella sulfidaeris]|uniref:3-hydroxyacyl-CoA dehydrogenase NAD binding domain-containing protein n=1 Tax=Vreelandella sulfidaeris TaxID=115553 RepID=A0A455U7L5_9GAMM|nr:hypothetical protein HSBAA_15440 [Halomonas sulfidaeris]